ncbi:MAG TPA: oligosaccharide flippase family protein [Candidatus Acidoferrales bacterium]|nr:oligosaccharide flippase family protein [Candidatus Acidoferrales bacterium]
MSMMRSVFSNWIALVILGLISFLLTPFMIHRLGDFEFGIYTLAFSVMGYPELLELGIRNTLQRFVGRLSGLNDRDSLNSVFSTALTLTLAIGAFIVILSIVLSRVLPFFFKLSSVQHDQFAWLVILFGLNVGLGLPVTLLGAYLSGLQRFDLQNGLAITRQGLRAVLIVILLLRGHGVVAMGGAVLTAALFCVPINWWMIRLVDPGVRFSFRLVSLKRAGELFRFSFWTLLNNAGQSLRDSTDSIVIGRVLGASLITPFSVASRLVGYFRPIIIGMVSPLLPRVSELDGQGRHQEIRHLFLRMTRLSALASLSIGSMLVLHGRTFLLFWVGQRYVSNYPILVLLTVGGVASLAQFGSLHTLIALGRHRLYGLWTIGEGLTNLILSIIWAHQYGIVGVAMGTAVPLVAVKLTLQPWYVTRVLEMSLFDYFKKALAKPLAVGGIFVGFCGVVSGFQANGNLRHLLGMLGWQSALLLVLAFVLGLDRSDRMLLRWRFPMVARLFLFPRLGRQDLKDDSQRSSQRD